jgi:co-chaperonin GroES (HSP10)
MKVLGDYIALTREVREDKKVGGFEYTQKNKDDMRVYTGVVIGFGNLVEGIAESDTVYYEKSRAFDVMLKDGSVCTMVKMNAILAID